MTTAELIAEAERIAPLLIRDGWPDGNLLRRVEEALRESEAGADRLRAEVKKWHSLANDLNKASHGNLVLLATTEKQRKLAVAECAELRRHAEALADRLDAISFDAYGVPRSYPTRESVTDTLAAFRAVPPF